ncbi:hypothetical protein KGR20_21240 [Cytobacillus oceanisediminis]|uniref:hypothetical protein n=1 Tax=Cytobacillus oceanisediminis TaxID=665099 RepID=UPI0011A2261F|nr:hypothetical protein [Cytobacillus oceanisediminis]MBZ9536690.1 hypothetical protein [Cytobacillus oceanisediminis]
MSELALIQTIKFFRSYGLKCEEELVEEWLNAISTTKDSSYQVCEDDLYEFNDCCRLKGTAYEEGIDDQTKIARLLEEVNGLKSEIAVLKKDKELLEDRLGVTPF